MADPRLSRDDGREGSPRPDESRVDLEPPPPSSSQEMDSRLAPEGWARESSAPLERGVASARTPGESNESLAPPDLPPPPDDGVGSDSDPPEEQPRPVLGRDLAPDDDEPDPAPLGAGGYHEPPPLPVLESEEQVFPEAGKPEENEIFFGELARLQRFVTAEQVSEALQLSERLRSEGRPKKLGKIMVKKGFLTATQAKYLLRLQRTPDPIDGYKLLERRGQGGMGVVYRAVQKSMRREVALKILAPKFATHARFLQRFFREARLAGTLNHPNIVAAIDVGECNGLHYLAMEYVDGWSVAEMLKEEGPFEEDEALDIVLQVAKALKEASAFSIIHRDVKPENILVTPDGVAKLADLGLSKQLTSDCSLTTEGKTLGTPFYVSPELARGSRDVDVRSDIYSLGATLYHMLTGAPPFDGDQPATVMARHIAEEHVPARRRRPDLSKAVSRLADRMLAKDPGKRYQTPDELMRDIITIRRGRNPFAAGALRAGSPLPKAEADTPSARPVVQASRRTTSPERPAYRRAGTFAAILATLLALVTIAIAASVMKGQGRVDASGGAPRADDTQRPEVPAPKPPPQTSSSERERNAQARCAIVAPEVGLELGQRRWEDAAKLADGFISEAAGTSFEGTARELRERVRVKKREAFASAIAEARAAVERGDFRGARISLNEAPPDDGSELASECVRLGREVDKELLGK